jgi:hypothetical protein
VVGAERGWSANPPGLDLWADVGCAPRADSCRMTTTEYALNFALVGLVALQIRGIKVTKAALLFPVVVTLWVTMSLLKSLPTAGNDLMLEVGGAGVGVCLGAVAAAATAVTRTGASAIAKAGAVAALLWVAGIGARVGFSLWVGHGGAARIREFSLAHHITGGPAWGTAFILMALAEVVTRTGVIYLKTRRTGAVIERGGLIRRLVTA